MDPISIKASELRQLLEDVNTSPEILELYFESRFSDPFSGTLKLKENVVVIPDEETTDEVSIQGLIIKLANSWARNQRLKLYRKKINESPDTVRLMSEGDSWFQHPHPKVLDIIDHLMNHYPVFCIGAAGDTVRNMFREAEYLNILKNEKPRIFLISGGGNDILGENFRTYLQDAFDPGDIGIKPERFLKDEFNKELTSIGEIYRALFRRMENEDLHFIIHGYDYVIPLNDLKKGWLGRYMIEKKITAPGDHRSIVKWMIDRFNETISNVAKEFPKVHYLDLRNTIRADQWYDEIHPSSDGYQDLALKYHALIDKILKLPSHP